MTANEELQLAARLLEWYRNVARDLPWRRTADAWAVLVSEVMLQQTQVAMALPFYERFVARFPTPASLAEASLDEVLHLWQGLGYYRRARMLHQAAKAMVAAHGGQVPRQLAALRGLPGIGDYTAGALASMVFGQPVPAIDANVNRVVTRLFALPGDPREGDTRRAVRERVMAVQPPAEPGPFNQAIMELGAVVCVAARPRCGECPVADLCRGYRTGRPERFPELKPAPPPRERLHAAAVVRRGPALLLAQRGHQGRWGGLWELPRVELPMTADAPSALAGWLSESLGVAAAVGARLGSLRHAVSGEKIALHAYAVELDGEPAPLGYEALAWVTDPAERAMPSPQRRLLAGLGQGSLFQP